MGLGVRLTLLGVGAMASPRFAPAGLLVACGRHRVAFDSGPGAELPEGRLDAWLVTDEQAELRSALRRLAAERGLVPRMTDADLGELRVRALPVAHTSHPTCGYRIEGGRGVAVWAPEFWTFPAWAVDADLMFAEASCWDHPIRFRGGVGGHAPVRAVGAEAARHRIGRLVYAHIGRPCLRAMDAGLMPEYGEWGREGHTYVLPPHGPHVQRDVDTTPASPANRRCPGAERHS
ncbi:hypothetical protein [Streptomyces sp. NPDC001135]